MNRLPERVGQIAACVVLLGHPPILAAGEFDYFGHAAAAVHFGDAERSWLEGGIGRERLDDDLSVRGEAQLGLSYRFESPVQLFAHAALYAESTQGADEAGLVQWGARVGRSDAIAGWRLRLGQFFRPGSQENTGPLWDSSLAPSFSYLNSWVANEIRPIGLSLDYQTLTADSMRIQLGGSVDYGNDSAGALLAWRGFARESRLSLLDEVVPLPELASLSSIGSFSEQRDDGTRPFGRDLDDDPGFSGWIELERLESWQINLALVDSRGDRGLHRGEYAWDTRYARIGATRWFGSDWTLLGEYMVGDSGMGFGPRRVDIDFDVWYLMVSHQSESWQQTLRLEGFDIDDRDQTMDDPNAEDGWNLNASMIWQPAERPWRLAFEIAWGDSDRERLLVSGLRRGEREISAQVEFRYFINP